jgi:hypothetical protein
MVDSTAQNITDTSKNIGRRPRSVKRKVKVVRTASTKSRARQSESATGQLFRQGKDAVTGVYQSASKARRAMSKLPKARDIRERGQSMYSMMEQRPLVMGAVGLGIGIALATLLPSMKSNGRQR